jgi:hypothetical protein
MHRSPRLPAAFSGLLIAQEGGKLLRDGEQCGEVILDFLKGHAVCGAPLWAIIENWNSEKAADLL